jgi:hypothetical protein
VCKQGLLVDPAKIAVISNLPPPKLVCQLRATLGHTCYYRKFIKGYAQINAPMEKLLKKDIRFQWNEDSQQGLDTLKENMVTTPIVVFSYWEKTFHVHVYASAITLGVNKPVLGGRICRWLFLFQEFDFEVIVKPGKLNARTNHLSRVTNGEEPTNLEDNFPDAQLFLVQVVDQYFVDIIEYLSTWIAP